LGKWLWGKGSLKLFCEVGRRRSEECEVKREIGKSLFSRRRFRRSPRENIYLGKAKDCSISLARRVPHFR